jgi:ABC-type branched-subunit amino acid transport system ATPase component
MASFPGWFLLLLRAFTVTSEILSAKAIRKRFGAVDALDGAEISVRRGETVGLIGPNGSGKTTLVNVISGALSADAGVVTVDGRDVTRSSPQKVASVGVSRTFQNIRLFAALTALENVAVGLAYGTRRERRGRYAIARQLLREVGIGHIERRAAGTLAYGLQRRVEIARALACGPRYLLLDEPSAGMNETESDTLLEMLRAVQEHYHLGVLIIDHDLRLIMRACSTLTVLSEGRVIASGTPIEVSQDKAVISAYLGEPSSAKQGEGS